MKRSTARLRSSNGRRKSPQALPADRLEVDIRFDAETRSRFSVADIARVRRDPPTLVAGARRREAAESRRLERRSREFLQGDASIRAYERLTKPTGETAILMISPPRPDGPIIRFGKPYAAIAKLSPDIRAFIAMAEGLRGLGYSAPADHRLQHRRRTGADRRLRRSNDRSKRRSGRRALCARDRASGRSARTRTAADLVGRRGALPNCLSMTSRRCWSRSSS